MRSGNSREPSKREIPASPGSRPGPAGASKCPPEKWGQLTLTPFELQRLATREFLAGAYSIADMACWGWVIAASRSQPMDEFPHVVAWRDRIRARPATERGFALGRELRQAQDNDPKAQEEARRILFGQRART